MNGFISNLRIIKGTALYTSSFTPPTRTLTNVTNTKLLCCQSNIEPGRAAVAPLVSGINNGTQWSQYLTNSSGGFQSSYPASKAFNGTASASETARSSVAQQTTTFAPPGGISYSSSVEVWTWYAGNVSLNGGSNVAVSDDQDWRTIVSGSGTLDNIRFIANSGNNIYLAGIRIDGSTILTEPITVNGNAAATTFNPFNTDINTVRGQESGYATLNPLYQGSNSSLSDGNLRYLRTANGYSMTLATMSVSSGKWYYEHSFVGSQNNAISAGIVPSNSTATYPGEDANSVGYNFNGTKVINTSQTSYGATYDAGDVIGVAFDADNGTVEFYKNGVNQGTATSALTSGPYTAGVSGWGSGTGSDMNFGQKPFRFPPPAGFSPLNAANVKTRDCDYSSRSLCWDDDLYWIKWKCRGKLEFQTRCSMDKTKEC